MSEQTGDRKCAHGREDLTAELRALALLALDRLEPLVKGAPAGSARPEAPSTSCPMCAGLALLRGEHPELAERLVDRAAGLVAVLREALDDSVGVSPPPGARTPRVQRIPIEREPGSPDGARC